MNYVVLLYLTKKMWFFYVGKDLKLTRTCEFQLTQLVKFLMGCIRDLGSIYIRLHQKLIEVLI